MRKNVLVLVLLVLLCGPLFAGYFDLALTFGTNAHYEADKYDPSRLKLAWGASFGVTDFWELDLQVDTQLIPEMLGNHGISLLAQRALLGQRSSGGPTAGVGINMLVGSGLMVSPFNETGSYKPSHLLLSFTPLVIGTPVSGKRERAFTLTLAYNMESRQLALFFDLLKLDFYLVGTYRQYH